MLGERIAEQRKKLGLSQEELEEKLNISQKSISKYELGDRKPQYKVLVRMAEYFGVTVDYLLRSTDTQDFGICDCGNTIKELRTEAGMTQEELGMLLNVQNAAVSKYESGKVPLTGETLLKLSKIFNVSTDYLLGAEEGNTMIGGKIAELRKEQGLNQKELAKKIGVSRSALSLYEIDRREPDLETVKKIASLFGVTTDYLLGAEGDAMGTEENTNEVAKRIGRNLKVLRESTTQRELAPLLGVTPSAVGMWESGRREPDIETLVHIAKLFEVTLDDLVMKELTPPVPLYVQNMIYLRKKRGYSQGELATVLGLQSASSIDLVESGKCELPVSKLVHLAEFFGVTMDQITKQDLSQEVSGCRQQ